MEYRIDSGKVGISQRTPDGFLRCYMRLAAADRPYTYQNALGGQRQEIVPSSALFNKDSADTFKMLPLTLRHPQSRIVTPYNAAQLTKGSTGHTVVREKTTDGEFLGIVASVFDRETIDSIENGWQISPGYRVKTRQRSDGMFEQYNRDGNHVAVVERARGGADVLPILSGIDINVDGDDELSLWFVTDSDDSDPIYTARFDNDLILPILAAVNLDEMATKTPVDLNRYKVSPTEAPEQATAKEEKTPAPHAPEQSANTDDCGGECGADCDCADCSGKSGKSKRKKKPMASLKIDGVTYNDIDQALAQAVAPHLKRSDSLDEVLALNEELAEALAESKESLDSASERIDSLEEMLDSAQERADSASDLQLDAEDALQINIDAVELVSSIRQDAAMILGSDFLKLDAETKAALSNLDARTVLGNLDSLQQLMITAVNPGMAAVLDSLDGDAVTAAYDASMAMFRSQASQRNDSVNTDGGMYGVQARMPGVSAGAPRGHRDFRKAVKSFHDQQDEAFANAGEAIKKSGKSSMILL